MIKEVIEYFTQTFGEKAKFVNVRGIICNVIIVRVKQRERQGWTWHNLVGDDGGHLKFDNVTEHVFVTQSSFSFTSLLALNIHIDLVAMSIDTFESSFTIIINIINIIVCVSKLSMLSKDCFEPLRGFANTRCCCCQSFNRDTLWLCGSLSFCFCSRTLDLVYSKCWNK